MPSSAQKRRHAGSTPACAQPKQGAQGLVERVEELFCLVAERQSENARLQQRLRELEDDEQQRKRQRPSAKRGCSQPATSTCYPIRTAHEAHEASSSPPPPATACPNPTDSGAAPSVWDLPEASAPAHEWDCCMSGLTVTRLLALHRQWLQEVALLLPKANFYGAGSPGHDRLLSLMDRYAAFNQQAVILAPEAWAQRSKYDLDTLEAAQGSSLQYLRQLFGPCNHSLLLTTCCREYVTASDILKAEYAELSQRHKELSGCVELHEPEASTGASSGYAASPVFSTATSSRSNSYVGSSCDEANSCGGSEADSRRARVRCASEPVVVLECLTLHDCVELEECQALMEANLWHQRILLQQCMQAVWQGLREHNSLDLARAHLVAYPAPLDDDSFLRALASGNVLAAVAQPATP